VRKEDVPQVDALPKLKEDVEIKCEGGMLVLYRTRLFDLECEASGDTVMLSASFLKSCPELVVESVEGDVELFRSHGAGSPPPPGDELANVMSVATRMAANWDEPEATFAGLVGGTDAVCKIPIKRFDIDIYYNEDMNTMAGWQTYARHTCIIEAADYFDNKLFEISAMETVGMDPRQRLVLEVGAKVLFGIGVTKQTSNRQVANAGCAVGTDGHEWPHYPKGDLGACGNSSNAIGITANRFNFTFNMRGPSFLVDTACSASLYASHYIKASLMERRWDPLEYCIAIGVQLYILPDGFIGCGQAHMLSVEGRCKTFNETADGYQRGDGTNGLSMKFGNLRDERLALFRGSNCNQDGRSASLTAPSGPAQEQCIWGAIREARMTPPEASVWDCHGTGTSLGDPIEVGSLRGVQETDERDSPVLLSSSKSNIGHLEANAGTTGLFKCILMSKYGQGLPNCHLYQLNPHLDVSGWPTWMVSECSDYRQQSGLVGVSSFGVSGTNSHAEVWAMCVVGPNSAGRRKLNYDALKQITLTCPVTLGPIDYLTGEPPRTDGLKAKADCLREELQPYDISSTVYEGEYRYRREARDDEELLNPAGVKVTIHGSWSGWTAFEEMQSEEDGPYVFTIRLGETRCESFFICLDGVAHYRFYPACGKAGPHIWVEGPDPGGPEVEGNRWTIDGRDDGIPAGTAYRIKFYWGTNRRRVEWEEVFLSEEDVVALPAYEHRYQLLGSWTGGKKDDMTELMSAGGVFEYKAKIGNLGEETFQLCRDSDDQQLIYPAWNGESSGDVPVRGPDDLGLGKAWTVSGPVDEVVTVRLEVSDGSILVSIASPSQGERVWESQDGWERHTYWLNFQGGQCCQMSMDPEVPGIFRARGHVGRQFDDRFRGICEFFNVIVDGDPNHGFFPDVACAGSAETIVWGPEPVPPERQFMVKSWQAGAGFEVVLDLRARDRRRVVTWTWDSPPKFVFADGSGVVA